MKATVDPDSAEGRAEIDRLQHQILQIYQSLRGRLRRENRASLKSQRAVLIQQLESLGMATKEQKGGSVVFTPVASGVEATIDPGIVVQSILDPRKTRKLEELTVPVRLDEHLAGNGCCKALISKATGVWPCDRQGPCAPPTCRSAGQQPPDQGIQANDMPPIAPRRRPF